MSALCLKQFRLCNKNPTDGGACTTAKYSHCSGAERARPGCPHFGFHWGLCSWLAISHLLMVQRDFSDVSSYTQGTSHNDSTLVTTASNISSSDTVFEGWDFNIWIYERHTNSPLAQLFPSPFFPPLEHFSSFENTHLHNLFHHKDHLTESEDYWGESRNHCTFLPWKWCDGWICSGTFVATRNKPKGLPRWLPCCHWAAELSSRLLVLSETVELLFYCFCLKYFCV